MDNKNNIVVKGIEVSYKRINEEDYICLTDISKIKRSEEPRFIIYNWMRNKETLNYLALWESLNNPNFNRVEFDTVTKDAGTNSFMISPNQWITKIIL